MNKKLTKFMLIVFLTFPIFGRAQYPHGIITGKFSSSGELLWERNIQRGIAYGNCTDKEANIYIIGESKGGFQLDDYLIYDGKFVAKYDSTGDIKWVKGIYGYSNTIKGVVADSNENCYVLGWVHGYVIADTFNVNVAKEYLYIIKYDKTGDVQWINTILSRDYYIRAGGISINEKINRIYVSAIEDKEFRGSIYSDSAKHILASFDMRDCNPVKEIAIINHVGYPFRPLNTARGITNDETSVYITGTIKDNKDYDNIYIAKLETGLNVLWEKQTESNFVRNIGYDIVVDNNKNIYITGIYSGTVWFNNEMVIADLYAHNVFVAKLNRDGDFIWIKTAGTDDTYDFGYSLCTDNNNNIYTAGFIGKNANFSPTIKTEQEGSFWAKLNEDGDVLFEKSYNTGFETPDDFSACYVDCDKSGNLCFTVSHRDSLSLDARLLKQGLNPLVNVYPNPCQGTLNTRYISGATGEIGLQVFNMSGQEVFAGTKNTIPGNNIYSLDLSNLKSGVYFLSISEGQKMVAINKFFIE